MQGAKYQKLTNACQPDIGALVDRLLATLLPWRCALCRDPAEGMDLCAACLNDLPWLGHCCRSCGLPLATHQSAHCGDCLRNSPGASRCVVALAWSFPVSALIADLKYRRRAFLARVLGELLAIRIREELSMGDMQLPEWVVPLPMHPLRELRRHYNHAALLADVVARELSLPVTETLRRTRSAPLQAGMSRAARLYNARNTMACRSDWSGARIALVDDVITTGSTMREAVRALKQAGAAEVQVWAVARA